MKSKGTASTPAPDVEIQTEPAHTVIRVLIADDQNLFRDGVAKLLSAQKDMVVVGSAETVGSAIEQLRELRPDVALVGWAASSPQSQKFFAAIHDNDLVRVEQMLTADPALARARNATGASAIMQARYEGRHELVALLRARAGELDVFEAATLGDLPRLRSLLEQDATLAKAFSRDGFTALHLATFFSQPEAAEALLRSGADVNAVATNPMKVAVINSAAASGRADLVKLVLRAGANPNARQMMGYTALHAAAARDSVEMVEALLAAGADPTLVNDEGQSPSDKAGPAVAALLAKRT